jgi:Na+/H+ antiporter NhaD/arsenite permease-like protein
VPFAFVHGVAATVGPLVHTILDDYVPFIIVLFALYTISGGICVRGAFSGTPWLNAGILALGTAIASVMGTTRRCC